jgi:hypothetical protein
LFHLEKDFALLGFGHVGRAQRKIRRDQDACQQDGKQIFFDHRCFAPEGADIFTAFRQKSY